MSLEEYPDTTRERWSGMVARRNTFETRDFAVVDTSFFSKQKIVHTKSYSYTSAQKEQHLLCVGKGAETAPSYHHTQKQQENEYLSSLFQPQGRGP